MNRIKIQHGSLKRWFGSGNLQLAISNLINVDQVKNKNEITLCETVSALSGGQIYLSCLCKKCISKFQTVEHVKKLSIQPIFRLN